MGGGSVKVCPKLRDVIYEQPPNEIIHFLNSTSCVSSPFPCDWCVDGHRCTHDTAENCRNDILVTGIKRVGPSIRSGANLINLKVPQNYRKYNFSVINLTVYLYK